MDPVIVSPLHAFPNAGQGRLIPLRPHNGTSRDSSGPPSISVAGKTVLTGARKNLEWLLLQVGTESVNEVV
jgi:hypothetical protein